MIDVHNDNDKFKRPFQKIYCMVFNQESPMIEHHLM